MRQREERKKIIPRETTREANSWPFYRDQDPSGRYEKKIKSSPLSIFRGPIQMIKAKNFIEFLGLPLVIEEINIHSKS